MGHCGGSPSSTQAAFEIADGVGRRPGYLNRSAFAESYAIVEQLLRPLRPTPGIEREVPSIEIDL